MALAWLTAAFGTWAFGKRAGFYAGLCMATCIGLFLFTRILIPDVTLTATIDARDVGFSARARRGRAASPAVGPGSRGQPGDQPAAQEPDRRGVPGGCGTGLSARHTPVLRGEDLEAAASGERPGDHSADRRALARAGHAAQSAVFRLGVPERSRPIPRVPVVLLHQRAAAAVSEPALSARLQHRAARVLLALASGLAVSLERLLRRRRPGFPFKPLDRAGKTRLLALCWTGFMLVFFTFSTTQEYYSMPCYPALALLLGSAMAEGGEWVRRGTRVLSVILACAALACLLLLFLVRNAATPGDISAALSHSPGAYTLSLGHMGDLTIPSFAYLRLPLWVAAIAFLAGAAGTARVTGQRAFLATALMAVLFLHAARLALVVFDPYMSSRPLARALLRSPSGKLIVDHHYYTFSSIFFYTGQTALLLNGRTNNLVYGSLRAGRPRRFHRRHTVEKFVAGRAAVLHRREPTRAAAFRKTGGRGPPDHGRNQRRQDAADQPSPYRPAKRIRWLRACFCMGFLGSLLSPSSTI